MSDRSGGWVRIGGPFPAEHVEELVAHIVNYYLGPDWGEPFLDPQAVRENLVAIEAENAPLFLCSDELPGGEPGDLLDDLVKWQVPHGNAWDGCSGAYDAGVSRYTPDRGRVLFLLVENEPALSLSDLRNVMKDPALLERTIADMVWTNEDFEKALPPFKVRGPLGRMAEELTCAP